MILNRINRKSIIFFLLLIHSFTQTSLALMGTNSSALLPSLSSSSSITLLNRFDYAPIAAVTMTGVGLLYYVGRGQDGKFSLRALERNTICNPTPTTRVLGILGLVKLGKLFNLISDKKFIIGAMASGVFFYSSFRKKLDKAISIEGFRHAILETELNRLRAKLHLADEKITNIESLKDEAYLMYYRVARESYQATEARDSTKIENKYLQGRNTDLERELAAAIEEREVAQFEKTRQNRFLRQRIEELERYLALAIHARNLAQAEVIQIREAQTVARIAEDYRLNQRRVEERSR